MELIAHPASPPRDVNGVHVSSELRRGRSRLSYRVIGGGLRVPEPALPERTDGLWRRSCFELFVHPAGREDYVEFNFSPSTQWAAYRFTGYREGMAPLDVAAPIIVAHAQGVEVTLDLGLLPASDWQVGLTAVIEELDGTKSYWALRHPDAAPDFHAEGGFALAVPAG